MLYKLFTTFFIPFILLQLGSITHREIQFYVPEVSFNETHNIFINNIDHFTVLYPKTLKAYLTNAHHTGFEDRNLEGFGLININVSDTDMLNGDDWVKAENIKRKNEPPIKIAEIKNYKGGPVFFLRTPEVIDSDNHRPIYGNRISAILIKDHKLYTFWSRSYDVEGSGPDTVFLEMVENFHFHDS